MEPARGVRTEEATVLGRGTRVLAGAVILACAALIGPSAPGGSLFAGTGPAPDARDAVPNRVMTWNLCNPCDTANTDRAAEIARYAPQVVALQEACVRDVRAVRDHLERLHGLDYHVEYGPVLRNWSRCGGAPWRPGQYGQAILSAAPITDAVTVEYPDGGSEDRGYTAVTTTVGGRSVRVFNTHLAERRQEEVRAEQAGVLASVVARHDRAIVLGDLNAVPDAPELAGIWDLAEDVDLHCRPLPAGTCKPTTDWHSKFDYVFLRGLAPLGHRVQGTPHSDHHLLYADVEAAGSADRADSAGSSRPG
ncbi:endonuclease/exonuclease/phosphatase family protein [Streptomyces sp. NPDC029526]|uniref:endonuclease/exonuclease/phosphatase family protein n=1 Tax=Streptomyces sp. NPDC029526 TaxID=3155728 RepID=UPI0033C7B960